MKIVLVVIILLHGLIHLMGFVKAFGLANISEMRLPISRGWGLLWLIATLMLILSGMLLFLSVSFWWIPAITGVILSQILVFAFWQDARFGSIPNMIIMIFIVLGFVRHTPPVSMMTEEITRVPYEERYGAVSTGEHVQIINPFEINIIPMERLVIINIENDPDSLYIGFEPQVFDDEIIGAGMLVIAWRTDGKVDVYHQPSLSPDPGGYDFVGQGLENMIEREMPEAFFEVNERGAQADVSFEDIEGRLIELKIAEHSTRTRKPFGLLAPMGMAAKDPSAMPMILLHDFYFVRRNKTEISVKINGRNHVPDTLPIPIDFTRMSFVRYCPDPHIATLNPAFDGVLTSTPLNDELTVRHGDHTVEMTLNRNVPEIQRISRTHNQHTVSLAFSPSFPNLESFTGEAAEGRFEISGGPSTGFIRGEYRVVRSGDHLILEMIPSGGWIPNESKLSVRLIYRVEPMFMQWPTTYRWSAELKQDEDSGFRMASNWERIDTD